MTILLPLIILAFLAATVVLFLWGIVRPPRKARFKQAGLTFGAAVITFVGFAIFMGANYAPDRATTDSREQAIIAPAEDDDVVNLAATEPESEPEPEPTRNPAVAEYQREVENSVALIREMTPADYTTSLDRISFALALFDEWASVYDRGNRLTLDSEATAQRKKLRDNLSQKQAQMLPQMRDKYGPLLRRALWIEDGGARTVGTGYRTIQFHHWSYAANREIQKAQETMRNMLLRLRFTRSEYRWVDTNLGRYSYYEMSPPKDGDVVLWSGDGFRLLP